MLLTEGLILSPTKRLGERSGTQYPKSRRGHGAVPRCTQCGVTDTERSPTILAAEHAAISQNDTASGRFELADATLACKIALAQ